MAPPEDFPERPVSETPEEMEVGTPQGASKRHFWSKPKVQDKPTRRNKTDFKKAAAQGRYPS